nr:MAG TPA: Putative metallopeptidase domain protein [Caudoviricetes sp.]
MSYDRSTFDEAFTSMMNGKMSLYCFYASMVSHCKLHFDMQGCNTAGVFFKDNMYNLAINTTWFSTLSLEQRCGILKHEMLHILGGHLLFRASQSPNANIAEDCAINQLIDNKHLPKDHISLQTVEFMTGETLDPMREYEYYLDYLDKCSDQSEAPSNFDDHEIWNIGSGSEEIQKSITKDMIEKASKVAAGKGNLPQEIEQFLDLYNEQAKVSWKRELLNRTGKKKIGYRPSILRVSRRFPNRDDLRGRKTLRNYNLAVVLDVSGSMDDDDIRAGLVEIHSICKITNTKLDIIQADTKIEGVDKFSKSTKNFKRAGLGGTYLKPGIEKAKELEADLILVITDGYCEDPNEWNIPKSKIIFILTTDIKFEGYKCFNIKDK